MTREIRFSPEATEEARSASRWYEDQNRGVGRALLDDLSAAAIELADWPGIGPIVDHVDVPVRRVPLARFPYHLVYAHSDDVVHVIAVPTTTRNPATGSAASAPDGPQQSSISPQHNEIRRVPMGPNVMRRESSVGANAQLNDCASAYRPAQPSEAMVSRLVGGAQIGQAADQGI